jgi:hypothetical protein
MLTNVIKYVQEGMDALENKSRLRSMVLVTGLAILFLPVPIAESLGFLFLRNTYRPWIGLATFVALYFDLIEMLIWLKRSRSASQRQDR